MEAVRSAIHASITTSIGPCTVRIVPRERCIAIILDAHPRHLIFVQPDK